MHGYNFTERVRKVLALAREEAWRLRHEYVGTEHILLGLIREGEGVAVAAMQNLEVDGDAVRAQILKTVKEGKTARPPMPDLPYTSRAKKSLEFAMTEARDLHHSYVGTEHLLLGLLREEKGIAAQVLIDSGLKLADARLEILRLLGTASSETRKIEPGKTREGIHASSIRIRVDWEDGRWLEQHFRDAAEAIAFLETLSGEGSGNGRG